MGRHICSVGRLVRANGSGREIHRREGIGVETSFRGGAGDNGVSRRRQGDSAPKGRKGGFKKRLNGESQEFETRAEKYIDEKTSAWEEDVGVKKGAVGIERQGEMYAERKIGGESSVRFLALPHQL